MHDLAYALNYRVFDEERYFTAGGEAAVFRLNDVRIGLVICEDAWQPGPIAAARSAGAGGSTARLQSFSCSVIHTFSVSS